jgi:membrane fusion protein, multidrug efflux system
MPSSISQRIESTGTLMPSEVTEIRPEISGRITQLNVVEGQLVRKGTLLIKLFDADLQASLRKLDVQLQIANKTEERQKELLKISGISQQDYDLSLLQVNNLKADIELMKVNIGKTEIRAPYDGRIGLRNISPGAYVTPANLITTISQVNPLKLEFSVPERYSSEMKPGLNIQFTISGNPTRYNARLIATETSVEENTRSLLIKAVVTNVDKGLVPGTFARVELILGRNPEALMIPTGSVIPKAREKQIFLFKGGKAVATSITTGQRDSSDVQVTSGLKAYQSPIKQTSGHESI